VFVDTAESPSAAETVVLVSLPGGELPLRSHEARDLAIALIEYAYRADQTTTTAFRQEVGHL
jgi:hypothetical protein